MNRKNTILIAVVINAGLIAVLLITAITSKEELISTTNVVSEASKVEDQPLFGDLDLERRDESKSIVKEPVKQIELPVAVIEEPVTHKLPPVASDIPAAPVETKQTPIASAPSIDPPQSGAVKEVVVKKGDSLEKIAKAHRMSVDEVIKLNQLPSSFLKIGQILKVQVDRSISEGPKVLESKIERNAPVYYTIKVGDNPWAIAMKHNIKVAELLRLNGLNEERARKLKPGDRLRVK